MTYKILADITIIIHFLWILFLIFGILFAIKGSKIAFLHIGGLIFSFLLNIFGWYCPLTHLENYLHSASHLGAYYAGSFITNYLNLIIYLDLPLNYIRIGGIVFVALNLIGYAYLIKKYQIVDRYIRRVE
jgi:hypothetical protein